MIENPKKCRPRKRPRKPSYYANVFCAVGCRELPALCEACLAHQKRRHAIMNYWGQHSKRVRESKAAGALLLLCDAQQATTSLPMPPKSVLAHPCAARHEGVCSAKSYLVFPWSSAKNMLRITRSLFSAIYITTQILFLSMRAKRCRGTHTPPLCSTPRHPSPAA